MIEQRDHDRYVYIATGQDDDDEERAVLKAIESFQIPRQDH